MQSGIFAKILRLLLVFVFAVFLLYDGNAQNTNKLYKTALNLFNEEKFEEALPLFLRLDTLKPDNFYIKYYIGACYLNTKYEKFKGIPYLEYALKYGKNLIPKIAFLDLAKLYHLSYRFDKSIDMIYDFLKLADKDEDIDDIKDAHLLLEIDKRAKKMVADSLKYFVEKLPFPVNTIDNSEYGAFVSADGKILLFTRTYFYKNKSFLKDSVSVIYRSEYENGEWTYPVSVKLTGVEDKDVSLVGVSFDANYIFLRVGEGNASDLYMGVLEGNVCKNLEKLPEVINSNFYEGGISFTTEGNVFYFSSNRPGGYGGKDIYKVVRLKDGSWTEPENLGPTINSKYDEDYPFVHPLGNILYFASNNPNKTIGGYDIYKTVFSKKKNSWSNPENLGSPINTPDNDISFSTNAEGNIAFYSSATGSEKGLFDIYKVELETSIPLTMIKGFIYCEDISKPLKAVIKVYDKDDNKVVKYVYNPEPSSGRYIMILPPGKDYIMVVKAEGFYPYVLEIHVPPQSYFYELYQEIMLKPVLLNYNSDTLGEKIFVKNMFYDTDKFFKSDTNDIKSISKAKNYDVLLNIVHDIVSLSDSLGVEYLSDTYNKENEQQQNRLHEKYVRDKKLDRLMNLVKKAIETTDTTLLKKIDENTAYKDEQEDVVYYVSQGDSALLKKVVIGNDTIYTARVIKMKNVDGTRDIITEVNEVNENTDKSGKTSNLKLITTQHIYYGTNQYDIPSKYVELLNEIASLLKSNENLYMELHGYADRKGSKEYNYDLSYKRVVEVSRFFKNAGIKGKRIKLYPHGKIEGGNTSENRRVDIKIFESK